MTRKMYLNQGKLSSDNGSVLTTSTLLMHINYLAADGMDYKFIETIGKIAKSWLWIVFLSRNYFSRCSKSIFMLDLR